MPFTCLIWTHEGRGELSAVDTIVVLFANVFRNLKSSFWNIYSRAKSHNSDGIVKMNAVLLYHML